MLLGATNSLHSWLWGSASPYTFRTADMYRLDVRRSVFLLFPCGRYPVISVIGAQKHGDAQVQT